MSASVFSVLVTELVAHIMNRLNVHTFKLPLDRERPS